MWQDRECVCDFCAEKIIKLPCSHSFCNYCFERVNKSDAECRVCGGNYEDIINVDESPTKSVNQNLRDEKVCIQCKKTMDVCGKDSCEICLYLLCPECLIYRREHVRTIYSRPFQNPSKNKDLFCIATGNNLPKSDSSDISDDVTKELEAIDVETIRNLGDLSKFPQFSQKKLKEINCKISKLNMKKNRFESDVQAIELALKERHVRALKLVNEFYIEQCHGLFGKHDVVIDDLNKEIKTLEIIQKELIEISTPVSEIPSSANDHEIIEFEHSRKLSTQLDIDNPLVEFTTISLAPLVQDQFQEALNYLIGRVHLFVNGTVFTNVYEDASVTSIVYGTKTGYVHDHCYDFKNDNLFVIKCSDSRNSILKFTKNKLEEEFKIERHIDYRYSVRIALLADRRILLLYKNEIFVFSDDLKRYDLFCPSNISFMNASAICTSPCLMWTYVYCQVSNKIGNIFRYSSDLSAIEKCRLTLTDEPNCMAVHANLDYIAFCGHHFKGINLCSFNQGKILYTLGSTFCNYLSGCFITDNIFIAYNNTFYALEMCNFKKKKTIRYIKRVSNYARKDFRSVYSMVLCSKRSLYVCDWTDEHQKIYRVEFKL